MPRGWTPSWRCWRGGRGGGRRCSPSWRWGCSSWRRIPPSKPGIGGSTAPGDPGFDRPGELGDNVVVKNVAGTASLVEGDRGTRERVARLLLELGPSTAAALSVRL